MLTDPAARDALALLASWDTDDSPLLARALVQLSPDDLQTLAIHLMALVHLRHTVATEIDDTRVWARWLLLRDPED